MVLNLARLKKEEILWLSRHRCRHNHTYLEHTSCIETEKPNTSPIGEKVGFLDIEAEGLQPDYDIMFSYYIKVAGEDKYYYDVVTEEDFKKYSYKGNGTAKEDTRILKNLIRDLGNFDRVIGHYSSRYDLKFARTRAVMCGVQFLDWGSLYQSDTWDILRSRFKLSRNSLEGAVRNLTGISNKNHLSHNMKHGMIRGEKWAQEICLDHNKRDVDDTERLFDAIQFSINPTKRSI